MGIVPLTLLRWMSNLASSVKGVKLNWASVSVMFSLGRLRDCSRGGVAGNSSPLAKVVEVGTRP